jgi:hypothetical protein
VRRPHYLKVNNSSEYPRHCIWLDTETTPVKVDDNTIKHVLNFGWACYRRRARGHKWSKPHWYRFTTLDQFWLWATQQVGKKECLTMFAHNGSFDLPVLDAFNWLQDEEWKLKVAVIESPPIILKWHKEGRSIKFIDTLNIWRMSLASIGESINLPKLDMPEGWEDKVLGDKYCKRDVEIIMTATLKWFDFLREHDLGGFAPTLASQAVRAYRHRFMHHKILIDDNEDALAMAREAYHGGRTECFYIGETRTPLYQLDVNSMYPDIMSRCLMPTKLIGVFKRVKHLELHKLLKTHAVIAEVIIKTNEPVYSQYTGGKLIFPIGTFAAVLSTPEILYALDNGHVVSIDKVAIYEQAIIFKEYVDYLYNMRQKYKTEGNTSSSNMTKILMNSLYGKFGQRGRVYETIEQNDSKSINTWTEIDADTKQVIKYRQFAGMVQELIEEPESRDSHPAIASHVTAYARIQMWEIYKQAGLNNCYYSDTDCVVVNKQGYDNLADKIDEHKLGMLKLEQEISYANIRGAKDYTFDSTERVKGVRKSALWLGTNVVQQEQWAGLRGLMNTGDLTAPTTKTIIKHLKRIYTKGTVLSSGRVKPFRRVE